MKKTPMILFVIAALIIVCYGQEGYAEGPSYVSIENSMPRITASGTGKVTTKPDEAIVSLGVTHEESSVKKVFERHTEDMNSVIDSIKKLGIKEEDIKTTSYSLTPIYPKIRDSFWWRSKPTSFRLSHQVMVKVRDLSQVGKVIDKTVENGATFFNGIEFRSSRIEELEKTAKLNAAKDARETAQTMAEGLGVKLGKVLKVDESMYRPYSPPRAMAKMAEDSGGAPQIEPGTLEVTATCSVIFEIIE